MSIIEPMIMELAHEAQVTRRVLECVPVDRFPWKPHAKSMAVGELASHIVETPSWVGPILDQDVFEMNMEKYVPYAATSPEELLKTFDDNVAQAMALMGNRSDEHMMVTWKMVVGGETSLEMPRAAVLRAFLLSHIIHHRGQLTVYLRMNDILLPSIYGPSADEEKPPEG